MERFSYEKCAKCTIDFSCHLEELNKQGGAREAGIRALRAFEALTAQTFQNPLVKEYTLNYNRDPIII